MGAWHLSHWTARAVPTQLFSEASFPITFSSHLDDTSTCARGGQASAVYTFAFSFQERAPLLQSFVVLHLDRSGILDKESCSSCCVLLCAPGGCPCALQSALSSSPQWDLADGSHWQEIREKDERELRHLFPGSLLRGCYDLLGSFYQKATIPHRQLSP